MEFVFANVADTLAVRWGNGGSVDLVRNDIWFADDPFVIAHRNLFSDIPLSARSTTGRIVDAAAASPERPQRGRRG